MPAHALIFMQRPNHFKSGREPVGLLLNREDVVNRSPVTLDPIQDIIFRGTIDHVGTVINLLPK